MDVNKAKDTIKKLLALAADDSAAAGEVDNAMRFAMRLMAEHQLSEADIDDGRTGDIIADLSNAELGRVYVYCGGARKASWEGSAAQFVCDLIGGVKCHWASPEVYRPGGIMPSGGSLTPRMRMAFYGVAEDAKLAGELFQELVVTIAAMGRLRWGGCYRGAGLDYCQGFVSGLHSQLVRDQQLLASESTGRALVVVEQRAAIVKRKEQLAEQYQRKAIGRLTRGAGYSVRAGSSAFSEGRADGARHTVAMNRPKKLS
jgi:hypothetical protein